MPYKCEAIIEKVKAKVAAAANEPRTIFSVFEFTITVGGATVKVYTIDLKELTVYEGTAKGGSPNVKVTITDDALEDLLTKKITLDEATKAGSIKVDGDAEAIPQMKRLTAKLRGEA